MERLPLRLVELITNASCRSHLISSCCRFPDMAAPPLNPGRSSRCLSQEFGILMLDGSVPAQRGHHLILAFISAATNQDQAKFHSRMIYSLESSTLIHLCLRAQRIWENRLTLIGARSAFILLVTWSTKDFSEDRKPYDTMACSPAPYIGSLPSSSLPPPLT